MIAESTTAVSIAHFVNGEFIGDDRGGLRSVNPAEPSDIVAVAPSESPDAVAKAVQAAVEAQAKWATLSGPARSETLYRWAESISGRAGELADAVTREVGKPIGEAKGEVARCVTILRYYAGEAVRSNGEVIPAQVGGALQYSVRAPLGVVGLITPWNFPLAIPLWKAAPALAFGNAVVMKPSEHSPYTAHLLAETAASAGLPAGLFNVVYGVKAAGEALVGHADVRAVSFTGSDRTGSVIARQCAEQNKKFQTEMGGKNVAIVLRDANLKQAATLVAGGAMRYAGQKCTATSRVVVEGTIYGEFMDELRAAIDALPVGRPTESETAIGPVITRDSQERIQSALKDFREPKIYEGKSLKDGYYVAPSVFADVDIDARLAQDELFGPILATFRASDLDHALELSNSTRFGLSASLFTSDLNSALTYVQRIEAGMVRVNADTTGVDPHAPFGGVKRSSSGSREQGPAAQEFYTETKTVQINPA